MQKGMVRGLVKNTLLILNKMENSEKIQSFIKEYGELVAKYNIDFATYPVWVPDGERGFRTEIRSTPVEMPKEGIKSPFIQQ